MADFSGALLTAPSFLAGRQTVSGGSLSSPALLLGKQNVSGRLLDGIGVGTVITVHYHLTATCSTDGLRHYWTDTVISFAKAPACAGGYVSGSLAVLGSWETFS
jgi:hypothetical protein